MNQVQEILNVWSLNRRGKLEDLDGLEGVDTLVRQALHDRRRFKVWSNRCKVNRNAAKQIAAELQVSEVTVPSGRILVVQYDHPRYDTASLDALAASIPELGKLISPHRRISQRVQTRIYGR